MAKHSHWHNIKHKKAANDKKRAAVVAKMGKLITVAVGAGGPNPDDNPRLRLAVEKARSAGMAVETIDRAIKKASGQLAEGKSMVELTYEGYAPGGIALVVDCLTDNRTRTAPEIKKLFERAGGSIGTPGCVAWQFKTRCTFLVTAPGEDPVMECLLGADLGVDDISAVGDGQVAISGDPALYDAMAKALAAAKIPVAESGFAKIPENTVAMDAAAAEAVQGLLDALDEHDDVQDVYHNGEWPEG
jgi:YebC/PmpR family DNA-binding regulatory protein